MVNNFVLVVVYSEYFVLISLVYFVEGWEEHSFVDLSVAVAVKLAECFAMFVVFEQSAGSNVPDFVAHCWLPISVMDVVVAVAAYCPAY